MDDVFALSMTRGGGGSFAISCGSAVGHNHGSLDWHTHMTLIGSALCRADDCVLQVADCSFDLHIRDVFWRGWSI